MTTKVKEPLLAAKAKTLAKLPYPLYASVKLNGIRCLIVNGVAVSRKFLPFPNKALQKYFGKKKFNGLDGEFIVGDPLDADVLNKTQSVVMSIDAPIDDVRFFVFDAHNRLTGFDPVLTDTLVAKLNDPRIENVIQVPMQSYEQASNFYQVLLQQGHEGVILRKLDAPYKFGRSTLREAYLIKHKPVETDEGIIIDFEEMMHNDNVAKKDAFGRTKRSSAKAGKRASGMLGAFILSHPKWGTVTVGGGFTKEQKIEFWANRSSYIGRRVTFAYFPVGIKNKPLHARFKGFRSEID